MVVNRRTKAASSRQTIAPTSVDKKEADPLSSGSQQPKLDETSIETADLASIESVSLPVESVSEPTAPEPTPSTRAKVSSTVIPHTQAKPSQGEKPAMSQEPEVVQIIPAPKSVSPQPTATIQMAGLRPIAASDLVIFGTYLNGRPISASTQHVAEMLPGGSPIFASDIQVLGGDSGLSIDRPTLVSDPGLMSAAQLTGGRPIFSNDNVDPIPDALMGYLD